MAFATNQQRVIKRTLTRSLIGFLLPMLLIGGLVIGGFAVFGNIQDGVENIFSAGGVPVEPIAGVVGEAGEVTVTDNTYTITIQSATAQPSAAFGSYAGSQSGGFLVIELSLTRTDTNSSVTQISWFDWMFTPESGEPIEGGALIAGGYEPLLSTLNL